MAGVLFCRLIFLDDPFYRHRDGHGAVMGIRGAREKKNYTEDQNRLKFHSTISVIPRLRDFTKTKSKQVMLSQKENLP